MSRNFNLILFLFLGFITVFLFLIDLGIGSSSISTGEVSEILLGKGSNPINTKIILDIRLTKAIAALLSGAALSVSGLQMQTLFRNPLAGPYVLGITSGASLGVAFLIIAAPIIGFSVEGLSFGIAGAAWIGAGSVLIIIAITSRFIKDIMVILILGMMFSSGIGAIVQILQYMSHEDSLKSFVVWTMGSLSEISYSQLYIMAISIFIGLILAVLAIKPLNQLLLGEEYARSMGLDVRKSRNLLFLSTTLLAGSTTAFCGPIGFIGLALPHITRLLFSNSDHRILLPGTILTGALFMICCDMISKVMTLPINAITALFGIPVIIWIVLKNRAITS